VQKQPPVLGNLFSDTPLIKPAVGQCFPYQTNTVLITNDQLIKDAFLPTNIYINNTCFTWRLFAKKVELLGLFIYCTFSNGTNTS